MYSSVFEGQFASGGQAHQADSAFAAALGTCPRLVEPSLLWQDRSGLAAAKLSVPRATMSVDRQITPPNYKHTTRIAAAGGSVSGSPPAWDPV